MRQHTLTRTTAETDIALSLCLDDAGPVGIDTGCGFFDHMLTLFARHGRFGLTVIGTDEQMDALLRETAAILQEETV